MAANVKTQAAILTIRVFHAANNVFSLGFLRALFALALSDHNPGRTGECESEIYDPPVSTRRVLHFRDSRIFVSIHLLVCVHFSLLKSGEDSSCVNYRVSEKFICYRGTTRSLVSNQIFVGTFHEKSAFNRNSLETYT